MTEAFVAIGLVSNIVQIIDFSSKLLSNSRELYRSSAGALAANVDIEAAASRLVLLNNKIRGSTSATSNDALKRICESCSLTADELLAALNKVKVEGKKDKWKSIRKALRSVWAKERIAALEERLAKFRHELNLHIIVDLREEVSRLTLAHLNRYNHLDMASQGILDAILKHQDVFEAVYETQAATIRTSHNEVLSRLETEHTTTRLKVIRETALIIEEEHVRTHNVLQQIQLMLQHILAPLTILLALVSRLCASSQQIYDVLVEMRSTRFLDTRWTFFQAPYVLEDALGRVYPIPSEYGFDLVSTVIKAQFRKAPGYRQVLLGNYELFSTRDTRKVISATTHLPPGTTMFMAILLNTPSTGTDRCPIPECRSTQCENRQGGGKICSACNVWFDFSSTKRRSFGDVAPTIEPSDYEWLADDLLRTSISDVPTAATTSFQIEDVNAYRKIKLSVADKLWNDEDSLEVPLNDGLCIFNLAGQVAFTRLGRDYRHGKLSTDDLCYSLETSFQSMEPSKVTVKVEKGHERRLDKIVMTISSSSPAL